MLKLKPFVAHILLGEVNLKTYHVKVKEMAEEVGLSSSDYLKTYHVKVKDY